MKLLVTKNVYTDFNPKLKLAFILASKINNKKKLKESQHLLHEVETYIHLTFNKDTIKTHHLLSPWVMAQEKFGKEARHYHTSLEQLMRKVLAGKSIKTNDVLTNLVRYLSLKHLVPIGVDNPTEIKGGLTFTLATGREKIGLLKKLKKGDFYYYDERGPLGTKLDYWKSKKTALTPASDWALLHLEALPPVTPNKLDLIVKEAQRLVKVFCGGRTKVVVLGKGKSSAKI